MNKQAWIRNLGNDPDRNFIIDGLTNGFEIIPSETVLEKAETSNYKSATASQFRDKVEKQIREEISKGNYVVTQAKPTIVSALGAIPKPQSDKIRLIHDCSRPQHSNVNSYATTQHFSYVTVEQAVSMIKPNAYLAKIDLKSAYRHVPIHPSNYSATGLAWQFHGENHITYLYDSKLPFGASKSPEIFHRLTQAVTRMMAKRGFHTILAYLDDFLIIGDSKYECELAYQELIQLLSELGLSINWEKAVSPTQRLTFLGIEIDTVLRQLCLPESKLCELRQLLSDTLIKRSVTKRDLQSLVGRLNFAARVVFGGRTFLRRTIDVMNTLSRPHHHIRVNKQLRDDLSWWASFLRVFNGKTFFIDSAPVSFEEFSTDACPIGGGGFFQGDWFYTNWAIDHPDLAGAHINLKETFTVLLALCRWKYQLRDKWIVVHSDNSTTISVLNKGTCRNPQVMQWLRSIFWLSATFNFRITARYIPSKANTMADAISRLHDPAFCHAFSAQLRRVQETNDSSQPHFSQLAFSSFPRQVQYMLKSSYSRRD